ncbi:MAG: GlsB/YeaQ/YmgE family stress response membrane protein [Kutzneria sp.]|nr:GlsB/YeaQ/YmgE family stress response membrane protein [Kutzneria sp.]MBV9846772.1 GlsB/YeaQ/YmgE family stress response membrane protein [Kutzneria sp.]
MGLIGWIVLGAVVGWAANLVVGGRNRRPQGCLVSILVGVAGAAIGGYLYQLVLGHGRDFTLDNFGFDPPSFGIALVGAIVLLTILRLISEIGSRK